MRHVTTPNISFVTPVTGLREPNTRKEDDDDDLSFLY
jgi:hypothetical protein